MRMINKLALGSLFLLVGSIAIAAESEFQDKMQEDLDGYKAQIVSNCGTTDKLTLKWNGKLGSNPRETKDGDYSSTGTLCTSALDGTSQACGNKVVKKAFGKVTSIVCQRGTGTISYSLKGSTLTFSVDPRFDKNNPAGQESSLVEKMKNDLDK
jgi:hypothetical protein